MNGGASFGIGQASPEHEYFYQNNLSPNDQLAYEEMKNVMIPSFYHQGPSVVPNKTHQAAG